MTTSLPFRTHTEMLAELVPLDDRRVVDVGCGSGELVRWMRSQGADAVGVECGEVMMDLARTADPDHPDAYLDGVGQDLPLPDASADVVVMSYSLHHVPRDEMVNTLSEAHRVLATGGLLYVVEPVPEGALHDVISIIDDETEVRGWAQEALDQAAEIGFETVDDLGYANAMKLTSAEGMAERIVGVDPTRAAAMEERRDEFIAAYEQLAATDTGGGFAQENRVRLFRRP